MRPEAGVGSLLGAPPPAAKDVSTDDKTAAAGGAEGAEGAEGAMLLVAAVPMAGTDTGGGVGVREGARAPGGGAKEPNVVVTVAGSEATPNGLHKGVEGEPLLDWKCNKIKII